MRAQGFTGLPDTCCSVCERETRLRSMVSVDRLISSLVPKGVRKLGREPVRKRMHLMNLNCNAYRKKQRKALKRHAVNVRLLVAVARQSEHHGGLRVGDGDWKRAKKIDKRSSVVMLPCELSGSTHTCVSLEQLLVLAADAKDEQLQLSLMASESRGQRSQARTDILRIVSRWHRT